MTERHTYECDRCGETVRMTFAGTHYPPKWLHIEARAHGVPDDAVDLCPDCVAALSEFMKGET